ncbi:MAG TPA: WbqC family protein, partial [Deltaproteobacteria bacterium]|nr:WbqC family protein [Deltaproteobacteria bacterium]HPR54937.1 WbqC family protein [Deltaproteobacteria bacterium]
RVILSAARPYFCPYPGYFARILSSDVFVVLDEVQFPRGTTWITRNRFKNDQGTLWMTIPVWKKGLGLRKISEIRICREGRWQKKHLASLRQAYHHAPYRDDHLGIFEQMFLSGQESMVEMNMELMAYVLAELGCTCRIVRMSGTGVAGQGTRLLVELCRALGADRYLVQDPARKWIDADLFKEAGIGLEFMRPSTPVYPQLWGGFIPDLSLFDLMFTCGPRAALYLT